MNADLLVLDAFVRDRILGWALSALYFHGVLVRASANWTRAVTLVTLQHRLEHRAKKTQRGANSTFVRGLRPVLDDVMQQEIQRRWMMG
jgi:hypothetical protein